MNGSAKLFAHAGTAGLILFAVGCSDNPTGPPQPSVSTLTVNAEEGWTYVTLGDPSATVSPSDPETSTVWELGFFATSVMLNGGAAGPGGVVGYCLCQHAGATDADIQAMTAESELEDFRAVTTAQLPAADSLWRSDALVPAIDDWYAYDHATHTVSAAPEMVWKVRGAGEDPAFAKFHVLEIENPSRENAGQVTFEFALQPSAGAAMGEPQSLTVDLSSGAAVYFDLETSAVSGASDWDLLFEGYTIRINGGVSGEGGAGASLAAGAFDEITDASDLSARHYRGDAFGGVFDEHRWYRYNLAGNHQIWPTFDVFLVKRGAEVYKLQLINYYSDTGEARHITFRYAKLEG